MHPTPAMRWPQTPDPTDLRHLARRRVGALQAFFAPQLSDNDPANLEAFQAACRPCINGAHGPAFTFRTEPLPPEIAQRAAEARRAAAHKFGVTRSQVDARLRNRIGELGDEWVDEPVDESGGRPKTRPPVR